MEAMAKDSSYSSKILGGQNPLGMYCAGVESLDLSNICSYDQGCNEEFQKAMKNYFEGKATKEDAIKSVLQGQLKRSILSYHINHIYLSENFQFQFYVPAFSRAGTYIKMHTCDSIKFSVKT